MENGTSAEMGLTGHDGVVGIAPFMRGGTMPNRAEVQSAGSALQMKASALQDEFARGGRFLSASFVAWGEYLMDTALRHVEARGLQRPVH